MVGDNFIFQFIGYIARFSDGSRLPLTLWAQVMGIKHSSYRLFRYSYSKNHSYFYSWFQDFYFLPWERLHHMLIADFRQMPHHKSQYPNATCLYWPPVILTEPFESHYSGLPGWMLLGLMECVIRPENSMQWSILTHLPCHKFPSRQCFM